MKIRARVWVALCACAAVVGGVVWAQSTRAAKDPLRKDLIVYRGADGRVRPVRTREEFEERRRDILRNMERVMGEVPRKWAGVGLDVEVLETVELKGYVRKKIRYRVEPEDRVSAYLLVPVGLKGRGPAVVCLHQTVEIGKESPVGLGDRADLHYAHELAERGYVTLAPDYWDFGDYRKSAYDPYKQGYQSGTMKGIWNHIRAIDVLETMPEVDKARIGCIGHSLGGHNALWLAAFDGRVKAVVSSCGFSSFGSYARSRYGGGDLRNWAQGRYMPRVASVYGNDPARMPFDWGEVLGAIAPRAVFINAPTRDENFLMDGVEECVEMARPVYRLMGAEERLKVVHPDAGHAFPEDVRRAAYEFLDGALGGGRALPVDVGRKLFPLVFGVEGAGGGEESGFLIALGA